MRFPLTKAIFAEFLLSNKRRQYVRNDSNRCPLARAISATQPRLKDGTRPTLVDVSSSHFPKWAERFIGLYDDGASAIAAARKVGVIK